MRLTELLISVALVGLAMAGLFVLADQAQRAYAVGSATVASQQNARVALERLAADLRSAGAGPPGAFDAIAAAEPGRVVLQSDLDGDGRIAGSGESVAWLLRGDVLRRDAGGGAQPVVGDVRAFRLGYLDARDQPTAVPGDVRTVTVTLTTGAAATGGGLVSPAASTTTLATRVRLRNR
ncbi:MAG: PilW family protein [Candidatus Rokuibacteriota bacterium]